MIAFSGQYKATYLPQSGERRYHHVLLYLDITEQKLQEQLLTRIADLDYDNIMEIDIAQDTYRVISLPGSEACRIPSQGKFQKEIRIAADKLMDRPSRRIYLDNLEYRYMEEQLEQQDSYSFVTEFLDETEKHPRIKRFQIF